MKSGSVLGTLTVLTAIAFAQAQSLGLGTGSRASSPSDSTEAEYRNDRQEEAPAPRKSQINKRLGLTARRNAAFDPKVFEARGRDLQGQFYEIGTPANPKKMDAGSSSSSSGSAVAQQKNGSKQWLIWVGVAGAAGAAAGTVGYLMMSNAHPASAPPDIPLNLDDGP